MHGYDSTIRLAQRLTNSVHSGMLHEGIYIVLSLYRKLFVFQVNMTFHLYIQITGSISVLLICLGVFVHCASCI